MKNAKNNLYSLKLLQRMSSWISTHTASSFVIIAGIFGLTFAILVPPMLGIDEFYHFNRAYQLSEGGFKSQVEDGKIGGSVPVEVSEYQWETIRLKYSGENDETGWTKWAKKAYDVPVSDSDFVMEHYPGAAAYNILSYLPAVIAVGVGDFFDLNFGYVALLSRVAMLAAYIVIVAIALYVVRHQRIKWLIFAFALWPKVLFQASVVTSDTLAIAFALLIFALLYKVFFIKSLSGFDKLLLVLSCVILPLIKFNYIFISLLTLLIPVREIMKINLESKLKAVGLKVLLLLIIIVPTLLWVASVKDFADSNSRAKPVVAGVESSVEGKVLYSLENPMNTIKLIPKTLINSVQVESSDYMATMAGYIGFNNIRVPSMSIFISWLLVLLAVIYAGVEIMRNKKYVWFSFGASAIGIVGVFAVLYLTWTAAGKWIIDGVQGRYFLPFIPFALLVLAYIPLRLTVKKHHIAIIMTLLTFINLSVVVTLYAIKTYNLTSF